MPSRTPLGGSLWEIGEVIEDTLEKDVWKRDVDWRRKEDNTLSSRGTNKQLPLDALQRRHKRPAPTHTGRNYHRSTRDREWWPPSKTTLETWTDKWNIQRKRWAAPFRSWKDVTRSVSSTSHRTPHIRGCWHFKSGQILEIETLFFFIFFCRYFALNACVWVGKGPMFLVRLRSWNWIFGGNVATVDVDNFYTRLKVSVSKGHPVQDIKCWNCIPCSW